MSLPKKVCSKCQEEKSVAHFHKAPGGRYGVHSICKPCRIVTETARFELWKAANPKRYKASQRSHYLRKKAAQ